MSNPLPANPLHRLHELTYVPIHSLVRSSARKPFVPQPPRLPEAPQPARLRRLPRVPAILDTAAVPEVPDLPGPNTKKS